MAIGGFCTKDFFTEKFPSAEGADSCKDGSQLLFLNILFYGGFLWESWSWLSAVYKGELWIKFLCVQNFLIAYT